MLEWLGGLISLAILAAYPASLIAWARLLRRRRSEQGTLRPLLPPRPRRPPFWSVGDLFVLVGLFLLIGSLLTGFANRWGWISPPDPGVDVQAAEVSQPPSSGVIRLALSRSSLAAAKANQSGEVAEDGSVTLTDIVLHSVTSLLTTLAMIGLLSFRSRRAAAELGLMPTREDLRLGLISALLILPPVTLIMRAATWFVEYEHAVLSELAESPTPPVIGLLLVSTVLIAPIAEEFTFRGLLQGALQRIADPVDEETGKWVPRADWPIYLSSGLFAAMHLGQGPAPIPLFFLSLGLGYLYRQTGSLIPPLIVHLILNAVTMAVTIVTLLTEGSL